MIIKYTGTIEVDRLKYPNLTEKQIRDTVTEIAVGSRFYHSDIVATLQINADRLLSEQNFEEGKQPSDTNEIGRKIKLRRSAMDMTQSELSRLVGCTQQQINKYETGQHEPSASRLRDIAFALRVSINDLV